MGPIVVGPPRVALGTVSTSQVSLLHHGPVLVLRPQAKSSRILDLCGPLVWPLDSGAWANPVRVLALARIRRALSIAAVRVVGPRVS